MAIPQLDETLTTATIKGKVGKSGGYGLLRYGIAAHGYYTKQAGIWQDRMTHNGKIPVKMRFYRPTNPASTPQEATRTKFAAGMAAWGALTGAERTAYTKRAKRRNMFGWGLFLRDYLKSP